MVVVAFVGFDVAQEDYFVGEWRVSIQRGGSHGVVGRRVVVSVENLLYFCIVIGTDRNRVI